MAKVKLNNNGASKLQKPVEIDYKLMDIDFRALIDLLSNHLYKDKSSVIRELLSNANDALYAREKELISENERLIIRLWLDHGTTTQLIVKDNGIGMSKDDLIHYLATIGAGLTKERRNKFQGDPIFFDEWIGRFGIGFLSAFFIAEKIIVKTRKSGNPGYCWQSEGERNYTITELVDLEIGTSVVIDLKPDLRNTWNDDEIKKLILQNARNFRFPIYWGPKGDEKLNDLQAPWYSNEERPDEEKCRDFLIKYSDQFASAENATEIIPLYREDIRGVVYFPFSTEFKHETVGAVDLYCRRVFVKKDQTDIVPREFDIIKGVVDCFNFKLSLSRDDVQQDNIIYIGVKEFIGIQIIEHICTLAKQINAMTKNENFTTKASSAELFLIRLQTIMDQYHYIIKNALIQKKNQTEFRYADHFLTDLDNFMPFQSCFEPVTTIPEYIKRAMAIGKDNEILFLYLDENIKAHQAISEQEKLEFIVIRYPLEEEYIRRYCQISNLKCISAIDVFTEKSFPKLQDTSTGWRQIINYFQDQLNHPEFSLSVYLSEFQPKFIPGRMLIDRNSEGFEELQKMLSDLQKMIKIYEEKYGDDKENPLYKELEKMKRKRPYSLYLNKDNPILVFLAKMIVEGFDIDLDIILHAMFHEIAVAAGHQVPDTHSSEYQMKVYNEVLEGISAKNNYTLIKKNLRDLEKSYTNAQDEIKKNLTAIESLRTELEELKGGKTPTSNEVFFIRPMREGEDEYDYIALKAAEICKKLNLQLVDPKKVNLPGNILEEILDNLRKSKFVIADISEITNPNVYFEVGYVHGAYSNKLILIAKIDTIKTKLPFDIRGYRALSYNQNSSKEFDMFLIKLEEMLKSLLAKSVE